MASSSMHMAAASHHQSTALLRGGGRGRGGALGAFPAAAATARRQRPALAPDHRQDWLLPALAHHQVSLTPAQQQAAAPPAAAAGPAAPAAPAAAATPFQQPGRRRRPDVSTAAKKRPAGGGGDKDGGGGDKSGKGKDGGSGSSKRSSGGGGGGGGGGMMPPLGPFSPKSPKPVKPPPRGGAGGSERADKSKADFSAYWALRFREFFSKRKGYLSLINKPAKGDADTPELVERIIEAEEDADERALERQVADLELARGGAEGMRALAAASEAVAAQDDAIAARALEQLERVAGKRRAGKFVALGGGAPAGRLDPDEVELREARAARSYVSSARVRILFNAMHAAARAARFIVTSPVTVPVLLWRRWRAVFETPDYDYWVGREAMRLWYWRNRTENERWFWEIYFWDRMLLPTVWTLVYVAAAPANLLWCAVVPLLMLAWRDGRIQGPGDYEWWLLMVFGVFGKCRGQITELARAALAWGV